MRVWDTVLVVVLLVLCRRVLLVSSAQSPLHFCLKDSVTGSVLPSSDATCSLNSPPKPVVVTEGDDILLQRALDMVKSNIQDYVALLFYSSWSSFSSVLFHGFPTLFLSNATMRVRYSGSRTLGSLFAFYSDVIGIKTATLDQASLQNAKSPSNHEEHANTDLECCPFS